MYTYEEKLQHSAIAEERHFNWRLKEEGLVRWWVSQAERMDDLQTIGGERLIVLESGQPNDGPGPDILRAQLLIDDFEVSGDVEMHMRAGDWYAHQHHNDKSYDDVILHVILGGDTGPDIPTLIVDPQRLGSGRCVANRSITRDELMVHAYERFLRKHEHLKWLARDGGDHHPLQLGMVEIIMSGRSRFKQLQQAAVTLGLNRWPDCRVWEGSYQSYCQHASRERQFIAVIQNPQIFRQKNWLSSPQLPWSLWSNMLAGMGEIGLSLSQCKEWLVNVLAPYRGSDWGFEFWLNMKVFRHYGFEKKQLHRMGLLKIESIAEQQALLAWKKNYCQTGSCLNCPLVQSHHALTHIN